MGQYTTGKTTRKRDKCISKKQSEISALKAEVLRWKSSYESQVKINQMLLDELSALKASKEV